MRNILTLLLIIYSFQSYSKDTAFIKVHFLYGSKPLKKYKQTEQKWFGGLLGGHAGVEGDSSSIVNFLPSGRFHVFAHKNKRHSAYAVHSFENFYSMFGGEADSVKWAIVYIPVTLPQQKTFDSLTNAYRRQTPYDYAFFGMRCGAATYDILDQLGILPHYTYGKTWRKIFYPKKLRKRLFKLAAENHWTVKRQAGTSRRKWEGD